MFHSVDVLSGRILYSKEAQAWPDFERQLAALRRAQQAFAARPVIERAALLHDLADKLAQARSRLAEMVCEEVGR